MNSKTKPPETPGISHVPLMQVVLVPERNQIQFQFTGHVTDPLACLLQISHAAAATAMDLLAKERVDRKGKASAILRAGPGMVVPRSD